MNNSMDLGDLVDPHKYKDFVDIKSYDKSQLLVLHHKMVYIRVAERVIAHKREKGLIGGPVHLGIGQEAVAVGVSSNLTASDKVFGAHRSHAHALALGSERRRLFSEVLGKLSGLSGGMGGSMHLWDAPNGFFGSVPIVAGTVSLAVGAGLAAKLQRSSDIGVSYFGDGAIEEGVVHEALNFAATFKIPVLFVVENNMYASHLHISERQPSNSVSRFAVANELPFRLVDGNDVTQVEKYSRELIKNIRDGEGPALIEAVTHRQLGHVDWREDIDVGVSRTSEELDFWKLRDPILRLEGAMLREGMVGADFFEKLYERELKSALNEWNSVVDDEVPSYDDVMKYVYSTLGSR
jgi:pyruvate dehydrogenase E1 component alpha subunit